MKYKPLITIYSLLQLIALFSDFHVDPSCVPKVFGTFTSIIPSHTSRFPVKKNDQTKRKEHYDPSTRAGAVTPMPASSSWQDLPTCHVILYHLEKLNNEVKKRKIFLYLLPTSKKQNMTNEWVVKRKKKEFKITKLSLQKDRVGGLIVWTVD